jgi:uncharacterized iron-regulated protein
MKTPYITKLWAWSLGLTLWCSPLAYAQPLAPDHPIGQFSVSSPTQSSLTPEAVLQALSQADVVYLGETHDSAADHQAQLAIIQALQQQRPKLAIGLEMFQRPAQAVLDRYLAGQITEAQLIEQSQFKQRWGFSWEFYAPILRFAKAHQLPVIALNTPTEVTRKVARQGAANLSLTDRRFIPPISALDAGPPAYRQMIQQIFDEIHQGQGKSDRFDRFFLAQILWDETMAERVSQFLQTHRDFQVVVLAGQGHIVYGYGIPSRVARRMQGKSRDREFRQSLVLLNPSDELRQAKPAAADYFWGRVK